MVDPRCSVTLALVVCLLEVGPAQAQGLPGGPVISDYGRRLEARAQKKTQPTTSARFNRGVMIEGTPGFVKRTQKALERIRELPVGKDVVDQLGRTGKQTVIREFDQPSGSTLAANVKEAQRDWTSQKIGKGSDASVLWNPTFEPEGRPGEVVLFHELVHALHYNKGAGENRLVPRPGDSPDNNAPAEELKVAGVAPFEEEPISENAFTKQWNAKHGTQHPLRKTYNKAVSKPANQPAQAAPAPTPAAQTQKPASTPSKGAAGALSGALP